MTSGIVMLGAQTSVVNLPGETNGYAPAFGRTECIISRVTIGKRDPAPSNASDLEAFSH